MEDYDRLGERIASVEKKIVDLEKGVAVSNVEFVSVKSDLKEIKGSLSWVIKLIIGALILAILGFVFGGGLLVV